MVSLINETFMRFGRRAEVNEPERLVATFVDAGPLMTLLSSVDHQVIYGRRGTGKTHALTFLIQKRSAEGDVASLIDMRTVGSTGGLYGDTSRPLAERATRLLIDTLAALHDDVLEYVVEKGEEIDLSRAGPILDAFADAISEVQVVGTTEHRAKSQDERSTDVAGSAGVSVSLNDASIALSAATAERTATRSETEVTRRGTIAHRIQFGRVGQVLADFARLIRPKQLWIVLDEWSAVPMELQPYLADLIRRSMFPVSGITVKIAAIEHRTNFRIQGSKGDYLGIELGADATADVNLDDFMVFDNNEDRAKEFFREFLFKHFRASVHAEESGTPQSATALVSAAFTQINAFDEFVRATEGVPRDGINILSLCAQRARDNLISVSDVRAAAKTWYQRDKESAVRSHTDALDLLNWIVDEVIGERRARAFLFGSNVRHELIDSLFDSRVLHILKRSISAHDQPGVRYDVYKLDYGCYVDLQATAQAPQGLLAVDDPAVASGAYIEVPPDDYRSIRRAILDLEQFERRRPAS